MKMKWKITLIALLVFLFAFVVIDVYAVSNDLHEGDYVVESGQTLDIKDKTLEINGNLILKEGSSLVMENAVLIIRERYKSEHAVKARGADVRIVKSKIVSSENVMAETYGALAGAELNLHMEEGTNMVIENSEVYGRVGIQSSTGRITGSTVSFVYWTFDSKLEIEDSLLGHFVFDCKMSVPGDLLLEGLKKDTKVSIDFHDENGGSFSIKNTNVKVAWSLNLEVECQKDVVVKDSELDLVWIKFPPTENRIKLENLPSGSVMEFDLKNSVSGIELPYNVKLLNVIIERFKPEMLSTKAEIINSHAMVHPYDKADLIIRDSELSSFFNYGSVRVEIINTTISNALQILYKPEFEGGNRTISGQTIGPGGYFHLVFKNSIINSPVIVVAAKEGIIEGEVKIISPKKLEDVNWVKGTAVRIYSVIAEPNTNVTLFEGDMVKWTGKTDKDSTAFFNITFDENSYAKDYIIDVMGSKQTVNFLSDTPIMFGGAKPEKFSYKIIIFTIFGALITALIVYFVYRKFKR